MEEELILLKKSFEEMSVKVIVLDDIEYLVMPNGNALKAKRGEEIELPRWLSNYLENKKIVKRRWNEITLEDISKIHYKEMSKKTVKEMEQLPGNFYLLVKEYIDHLEKMFKTESNTEYINEKEKATRFLNEIIDKRIKMIVNYIISYGETSAIGQKLLPEEALLAENLKSHILTWRRFVSSKE